MNDNKMNMNEFLQIRLGVTFEDKYNSLATIEIRKNREKYPLIARFVDEMADYAEEEDLLDYFDCPPFDFDDPDYVAGYDETMELYRAFVRAFAAEMQKKPLECQYASFEVDYLWQPNTHAILDPYTNYLARYGAEVKENSTRLTSVMKYPIVSEQVYLGSISTENYTRSFIAVNDGALEKIGTEFLELFKNDCLFANRFDNKGLSENATTLKCGTIGYPLDVYTVTFGKNTLRFFSTERGFDALSTLRFPVLDCLTDEQRAHEIVQKIVSFR